VQAHELRGGVGAAEVVRERDAAGAQRLQLFLRSSISLFSSCSIG